MPRILLIAAFGSLISIAVGCVCLERLRRQQRDEMLIRRRIRTSVPDSVPDYIYQPLGDPGLKTIRLIELLPFDPEHPQIRINLRTTSLAVPVSEPYEAISYCWGDPTNLRSIYCNGSKLWITASLRNSLARLYTNDRNDKRIRVLWADAICINQKDLDEKNWQVRMMSDIYRNAARVMIYLGEHSYHSELLKDFLPSLAESKMRIEDGISRGDLPANVRLSEEQRKRYNVPTYDWSNWIHFLAIPMIISRPWFRRVWTIQELVLAKDAIVMCGDWEIPWIDFRAAVEFTMKNYSVTGFDIVDSGPNRASMLNINVANAQEASLFQLLALHRGTLATNPLDHIFALLSLACDGDQVEIDYTKPVRQLYEEIGRYLLDTATDLSPLNLAGLSSKSDLSLPSWVPDWRNHMTYLPMFLQHEIRQESQKQHTVTWDGGKLKLTGIMLDSVALMGRQSPEPRFEDVKPGCDSLIEILAVWGDWIETFDAYSAQTYNLTGETWPSAFWDTLVGLENIDPQRGWQGFRQLDTPIYIAKLIKTIPFPSDPNLFTEMGPLTALKIWLFKIPVSLFIIYQSFRGRGSEVFFEGIESLKSTGRRMIQTKSGYLCLTPRDTNAGDHIFLLQGGPTYYVLRKQSGDNTYALIGDCYVHGLSEVRARELGELHPIWLV